MTNNNNVPEMVEQQIINTMSPQVVTTTVGGWHVKGANFESMCKRHANSEDAWSLIDGNDSMSFSFSEIRWDSGEVIKSCAERNEGRLKESDAGVSIMYDLGVGLSVEIFQDNYQWQKVVHIASLQSLGTIPLTATCLEIMFDIETSVELPNGIITESNKISDNCFLQPVKVWDANDAGGEATGEIKDGKLIKRIPVKWLISASYPMHADATITFGAENVFNAATTYDISIAALDATHFVAVYYDGGNSNHGTAIVGVVSGTTISSYGAENVFNAASTYNTTVAVLDSTHFVVAYRDSGNSNHGTAIVGVVSGTTISSYGAENVFNAARTDYTSIAALDATHFVIAYDDDGNSSHGTAIVGVVSGTTISSYGAENVFNAAITPVVSVTALDSTHFAVAYRDDGNSSHGTAIVGVVSGTTISSYGAENVFNAAIAAYSVVTALDSTHFAIAYSDDGNSDQGTGIIGSISSGISIPVFLHQLKQQGIS